MEQGDLQRVFNRVLLGDPIKILFFDRKAFESCRVALTRKFTAYKLQLDSIGVGESVEGKYIKAQFSKADVTGTFSLAETAAKPNRPYQILADDL